MKKYIHYTNKKELLEIMKIITDEDNNLLKSAKHKMILKKFMIGL